MEDFESRAQFKLLAGVPLIIHISGRNFSKILGHTTKPYSKELAGCFHHALRSLCMSVEGTVFGYTHNDEILLITINDGVPWYDNDVQKIASATASMTTFYFYQNVIATDLEINLDTIFTSSAFIVPSAESAADIIIEAQLKCQLKAVNDVCFYTFIDMGMTKDQVIDLLSDMTPEAKTEILRAKAGINFSDLPLTFRRGAACYRVPKLINGIEKYKFAIHEDLPLFDDEKSRICNIINGNHD